MKSSLWKLIAASACLAAPAIADQGCGMSESSCAECENSVGCENNASKACDNCNAEGTNTVDKAAATSKVQLAESTSTSPLQQADVVKLSEAFGHLIGRNLDNPGIKFDLEGIVKGMRDAAAGMESPMTEEEYEEAIAAIQESAFNELANNNLKEANTFMESNAAEEAIVEVEPGKLQYRVMAEGKGSAVQADSVPTIRYTGTYIDGTLFGSSEDAGGPVTLPLEQTIPGFQKGLLGMKEGEKRRIYIHPDLGYGTAGHLPPNSLLVFDVEIVSATDGTDLFVEEVAEEDTSVSEDQVAETQEATEASAG